MEFRKKTWKLTRPGNEQSYLVTETNLNELYWTPFQQLAHLGSAGEGLSTGDIFGTGTVTSAVRVQSLEVFHQVN